MDKINCREPRAFIVYLRNVALCLLALMPSMAVAAGREMVFSNHPAAVHDPGARNSDTKKPNAVNSQSSKHECQKMRNRHLAGIQEGQGTPPAFQGQPATGIGSAHQERRSSFLPIWGDEAQQRGYKLPNPFGVSPGYFYGERDVKVDSVDVDVKGMTLQVDKLADVKVKSTERNWAVRCDAWLFPFLNLYLIGGYTWQHTDAGINVDVQKIIRFGSGHKRFDLNIDFVGPTYGGGTTLVGGYKNYFAAFDTNYTLSKMEGDLFAGNTLSQQIKAIVSSVRLGWTKKLGNSKINLWIGETYWETTNTIKGNPDIPVLGAIDFTVQESTEKPYSTHIGTHIEMTDKIQCLVDMGTNFSGLFCVAPSFMFRF